MEHEKYVQTNTCRENFVDELKSARSSPRHDDLRRETLWQSLSRYEAPI
jgi:hypothetical protein